MHVLKQTPICCGAGIRGPQSSLGCGSGEQPQGAALEPSVARRLSCESGGAAVDVHGLFVNSLIPSSGVKTGQPSVRALAPAYF